MYLWLGTGTFLTSVPSESFSLLIGGKAGLDNLGRMSEAEDSTPEDSTDSVSIRSPSDILRFKGFLGTLNSSFGLGSTSISPMILEFIFKMITVQYLTLVLFRQILFHDQNYLIKLIK